MPNFSKKFGIFEYRTPILFKKEEFELFMRGYKSIEHIMKPVIRERGNVVLFYGWERFEV